MSHQKTKKMRTVINCHVWHCSLQRWIRTKYEVSFELIWLILHCFLC